MRASLVHLASLASVTLLAFACGESPPPVSRPPPAPPPPVPTHQPMVLTPAPPPSPKDQLFELLGHVLGDEYAPGRLKRHELSWEPDAELAKARAVFDREPAASKREKQRALYELMRSSRDIHTGASFRATHAVWLGIHLVKVADGSYRVAWRDASRTKGVALGLGDRVESIDGVPIADAVAATTRESLYRSTPSFEQAFAEWFLVLRSDDVWRTIPAAGTNAVLAVRSARDKTPRRVSLPWLDYDASPPSERCPFWGKSRSGFLPELGPTVWKSAPDAPFPSYVLALDGLTWGYVRFWSYALEGAERQRALDGWVDAIKAFKKHHVRGLVIDQLGNEGGNFLFAYELFSRLTEQPLRVPIQHYLVTENHRIAGFGDAGFLGANASQLATIQTEEAAGPFLQSYPLFAKVDFLPKSLGTVQSFQRFFTVLAEQAKGPAGLTEPLPSLLSEITPNPDGVRYSGPVALLVDGMNISAAEFAAAALADAGRAELVGVTSAGAGGDQRTLVPERVCDGSAPNPFAPCVSRDVAALLKELDVSSLSYTVTLGRRVDAAGHATGYIENRGVAPPKEYHFTGTDLGGGFREFRKAMLAALR